MYNLCLPHACGDVPVPALIGSPSVKCMSSPRMWGCSPVDGCDAQDHAVFPTHVGMFLTVLQHVSVETSSSPHMWGFPKKAKIFLFCLRLESACYISAFNEPILVGSLSNHLCVLCRPSSSLLDRVWELWVAHHISALFVNLTFHLRRNHHVRRICSRSQFCYFFSRR